MKIIIAGSNSSEVDTIKEKVLSISSDIATATSVDVLCKFLDQQTSLVIVDAPFLNTLLEQNKLDFLDHTPCLLILEEQKGVPDILFQNHKIDCLFSNTPLPWFVHKIQFLLQLKSLLDQNTSLLEENKNVEKSIEENLLILDSLMERDALTGLYNRRHFNKTLPQMFFESRKYNQDISLILLNIDYFSQINKYHGQQYGDFILNELAARITKNFRDEDITCRFGGEEFSILLPETSLKKCIELADKLRLSCSDKPFDNGEISKNLTVSIGCASLKTCIPQNYDELIVMAETALFTAKSEGRNRVVDYQSTIGYRVHDNKRNFLAIKNNLLKLLNKSKTSTLSSLELLAKDISCKEDEELAFNMNHYINLLCKKLNLPDTIITTFNNAVALHSSLRNLLHSEIIHKKDLLNKAEQTTIQEFPYRLTELTELFDFFSKERSILLSCGENYDGTGYPEGLSGNEIPLGGRIFSLTNALAAMTADRPYRKKLTPDHTISELIKGAGKQFDPFLVKCTIDIIREHNLLQLDEELLKSAKETLQTTFPDIVT